MFKQLSPSIMEKMKTDGRIVLTVKSGWETATEMDALPYKINLYMKNETEHLFNCYLQINVSTIAATNITPSSSISGQKNIIDCCLYLAIDGLVKFAKIHRKNRIIIDTNLRCAADHLPHYGFELFETDTTNRSIKGTLLLK